jgi:putative phosphoribosyl transferase
VQLQARSRLTSAFPKQVDRHVGGEIQVTGTRQGNPHLPAEPPVSCREVCIPPLELNGTVCLPPAARGLVVFVHGSGSSRFSPRNVAVAEAFNQADFATLLFDLLTPAEEEDRRKVFDIPLLADRLLDVIRWVEQDVELSALPLGLFGASTGAAAALVAAARMGEKVRAVVSRGGRPDLAATALDSVSSPTLLVVGGHDDVVIRLNELALARLRGTKALWIVPGATHLFPEHGALEAVIEQARKWFSDHLSRDGARAAPGG